MKNVDLYESKNIKPMLIGKESSVFDDPNYIYELKWDGERCVAYLEPGMPPELRNKRNVRMLAKVPELTDISKQVKTRCILDGELFILKNGRPDFSAIQRRSLMGDPFKIQIDAQSNPASFVAFDLLYTDNHATLLLPLKERKELLLSTVTNSPRMAVSQHFYGCGTALFDFALQAELEGIVAKHQDSIYIQGKRTTDWIKMKIMMEADYVVCGYIHKGQHMSSIVLGQYLNGMLIYKGHVTMGISNQAFSIISSQPKIPASPFLSCPNGHGNNRTIWLSPNLVCTVKFMHYTKAGGMRQPVFKGLRFDKPATDCIAT